jgi:hypothetical protein
MGCIAQAIQELIFLDLPLPPEKPFRKLATTPEASRGQMTVHSIEHQQNPSFISHIAYSIYFASQYHISGFLGSSLVCR